jgi:hypothetical protein
MAAPAHRHSDGPVGSRGTSLASGSKGLADVDRPLFTRQINDHNSSDASSIGTSDRCLKAALGGAIPNMLLDVLRQFLSIEPRQPGHDRPG